MEDFCAALRVHASASKLLSYLLPSATKPKEGKPPLVDSSNSSAHKRSLFPLRYLLRSATKSKEGKPPLVDFSNSSAHKRGKLTSSVSKSVGVLDLSDKKPVKPPIRLSVSSKLTARPAPRTIGNITLKSET
ncbi:uncharacterized protein Fot_21955 [Forsythia ovata]|uniref:Uncharacterized protein n=1 Tax=Forsythia ovata TaxID=205694 RepID=A0ABD1UWF1_9LAMI